MGDLRHYPGIGGWRRDRTSTNQTVVIVVGSSSHATHRVAGSGRPQQGRYWPVPSVIVLHVQQENVRSAWCGCPLNRWFRASTDLARTADQGTGRGLYGYDAPPGARR